MLTAMTASSESLGALGSIIFGVETAYTRQRQAIRGEGRGERGDGERGDGIKRERERERQRERERETTRIAPVKLETTTGARMLHEGLTAVGFEPTQLALVELESTPLDHSGKLSLCSRTLSVGRAGESTILRFSSDLGVSFAVRPSAADEVGRLQPAVEGSLAALFFRTEASSRHVIASSKSWPDFSFIYAYQILAKTK